ncbi:hypothetical protein WM00_34045 [Burkholderia cepacia]|nr:hypothetical protein WM00_34045 [Burkholderia cepacia]
MSSQFKQRFALLQCQCRTPQCLIVIPDIELDLLPHLVQSILLQLDLSFGLTYLIGPGKSLEDRDRDLEP